MSKDLFNENENKLEVVLGLKEKSDLERFYEHPNRWTFRKIPKREQTLDLVQFAVKNDGIAIKSVSKKLITKELCETAVKQNGRALSYIPESILKDNPELYEMAVENDGSALQYVPESFITYEMALQAVCHQLILRYDSIYYPIHYIPRDLINEELVHISIQNSPESIKDISDEFLSKELCFLAVSNNGRSIKYIPSKYIDKEIIKTAIDSNSTAIEFVQPSKRTKKLCMSAFSTNPFVIKWIPEKYITLEMCLTVIAESSDDDIDKRLSISWFPDSLRNNKTVVDTLIQKIGARRILFWNERLLEQIKENGEESVELNPLYETTVEYLKSYIAQTEEKRPIQFIKFDKTETPSPSKEAVLVKTGEDSVHSYDLAINDDFTLHKIYYITDLHLEHQLESILENGKVDFEKINNFINEKIQEMLSSVKDPKGYLLIGGDVGHTKGLVRMFYTKLIDAWSGTIISVLGNHELWDNHPEVKLDGYVSRPLNEIFDDYRQLLELKKLKCKGVMLQNEILINYKNKRNVVISEEMILNSTDEDLRDLLSKSTFILLGGIGFSGLNQKYNAAFGLYRSAITTIEEDKKLSNQFKKIYDKVNRCAGDKQVIVLTHMPIYDWSDELANPNWIYINGHTHQNSLVRKQDGTTVLSDNQIGYKLSKWKLNSFTISGWYDPFRNMPDGVRIITSDQYKEFNLGRGINSNGCSYPGMIYVLKRNNIYMFLLQTESSLCLLSGGQRKKLKHYNIQYYYDNMELYTYQVKKAIAPYYEALSAISKEVKHIGGLGTVHGCIVDIDWFNHIYLNPFDGKITPYYADDITSRLAYKDLPSLIEDELPQLSSAFSDAEKKGAIPLLSQYAVSKNRKTKKMEVATVPQLVLGTEMYEPSRIMKSIQYIFDENIIRIWNDQIISTDFNGKIPITALEDKSD